MDNNNYQKHKRYQNLYLEYKYVKFLVDYLNEKGYLEFHKGVNYAHFARCARMKATQKLLRLFRKYRSEGGVTMRPTLPIILRNEQGKDIDFDPNTDGIRAMIQNVNKINKCLMRHDVKVIPNFSRDSDVLEADIKKYRNCQKYSRIFNNSSFDEGGRFYGHWSQFIKSEYRQDILIDGEQTVELDYSCLHIFILYCQEGIKPPVGDLYNLLGTDPGFRSLIKIAVNIALNAENETKAKQAIHDKINDRRIETPDIFFPTPTSILEAIRNTHPQISKYICTGMGIRLQNMDSQIAERILLHFAERDICCLSIHDSFIVARSQERNLYKLMRQFFMDTFNYMPRIKRKGAGNYDDSLEDLFPTIHYAA